MRWRTRLVFKRRKDTYFIVSAGKGKRRRVYTSKSLGSIAGCSVRAPSDSVFCQMEKVKHW